MGTHTLTRAHTHTHTQIFLYSELANDIIFYSSWLDSLIWTGYKRELKQEDLYAIPDNCRSQKLLREFKR